MKKMNDIKWAAISLLALLFCNCERDGWDESQLYILKSFQPVEQVAGEGGFGRVMLNWQLPDSTSSLNYIDVQWKTADGQEAHRVFAKYLDTVWIEGLAEADYTFKVVSCSDQGEKAESPEVPLFVTDWQKEPAAAIGNFSPSVAENFLFLDWKHPQHRTYTGVNFKLYEGETLVKEVFVKKDETPEYTFSDLKYSSAYQLTYQSVNLVDSLSGLGIYDFETGLVAPKVPEVTLGDRINYAHSADIQWTLTADMDSLAVKFVNLNGEKQQYYFGITEDGKGEGYVSLLPGGTISIEVQARGTNGTWSLPQTQKIKTRLKEEVVHINDAKVAECLVEKLGVSAGTKDFSFEQLATIKEVTMKYQIQKIEEVELLVNLEILQMTASYPPGVDVSPTVESFLKLIDRLPKIKELRVQKGWPRSADIQKAFKDHPKVKFTLN